MFVFARSDAGFFLFQKTILTAKKGADKVKDLRVSPQTDFADLL